MEAIVSYQDVLATLFSDGIRHYVPDGTTHSEPLIGLYQGNIVDCFFLYDCNFDDETVTVPHARLAVDSMNKTLVYYYSTEEKPFECAAHTTKIFTVKEQLYDDTYKSYELMYETSYQEIRSFAFETAISKKQKEIVLKYLRAFNYMTDTIFKPFYIELSPEFFNWIKTACKKE
jgi:hypothetical protein